MLIPLYHPVSSEVAYLLVLYCILLAILLVLYCILLAEVGIPTNQLSSLFPKQVRFKILLAEVEIRVTGKGSGL